MNDITKKNIGKIINNELAEKGIMQKELAEHLGVTANTVSYYLSGERCPDIDKLIEISRFLNVSTDYLLGISDVKSIDMEPKAIKNYTGLSERAINTLHHKLEDLKSADNNEYLKALKNSPCYGKKYKENDNKCTVFDILNFFLDGEMYNGKIIDSPNISKVLECSANYVNGLTELNARIEKLIEKYNPDLLVDSDGKIDDELIAEFADERYSIINFEYPGIRNNIFEAADELKKVIEEYAKDIKAKSDELLLSITIMLSPIGLSMDVRKRIDEIEKEGEADGEHN